MYTGIIAFIIWLTFKQSLDLQTISLNSFIVWFLMDIFVFSSGSVFFTHYCIPLLCAIDDLSDIKLSLELILKDDSGIPLAGSKAMSPSDILTSRVGYSVMSLKATRDVATQMYKKQPSPSKYGGFSSPRGAGRGSSSLAGGGGGGGGINGVGARDANKSIGNINQTGDENQEVFVYNPVVTPSFNAANYFFVSSRLVSYLPPSVLEHVRESTVIQRFSTLSPAKRLSDLLQQHGYETHTHTHTHRGFPFCFCGMGLQEKESESESESERQRQGRKRKDNKSSFLSLFFAAIISNFLNLSEWGKDLFAHMSCVVLLGLAGVAHVKLYNIYPALTACPTILAGKKPHRYTYHIRMNSNTHHTRTHPYTSHSHKHTHTHAHHTHIAHRHRM